MNNKSPKNYNKNKQLIQFIMSKCSEIKQHPSLINNINLIIEKYLNIQIQIQEENQMEAEQMYEEKLNAFIEICQLLKALSNKFNNETKNNWQKNHKNVVKNSSNHTNGLQTFVDKKSQILNQIFLSSQISFILKNQSLLEIYSEKINEIYTLLLSLNKDFIQNFIKKVILPESSQILKDKNALGSLYHNINDGNLLISIFENLYQKSKALKTSSSNKKINIEQLSIFITNIQSLQNLKFPEDKNKTQNNLQYQGKKLHQAFKKAFQTLFIQILNLIEDFKDIDLAISLYRKLDSKLMSKMSNPLILSSYFLDKFKQQPQIQIQVLSCLFILVGKYGLQFENFYPQLEKAIQQKNKQGKSIYQLKNSKRFFKLVENALRSSKVPFKTIETMTRTMMSQIMQQQSQFAFWALSFFFNLTKKHRKLLDHIKNIPEITLLQRHYNPKIRSLVNELKKDLNKAEYLDIEKFAKIDCKNVTQAKVQQICNKLNNQRDAQFKITGLYQDL